MVFRIQPFQVLPVPSSIARIAVVTPQHARERKGLALEMVRREEYERIAGRSS